MQTNPICYIIPAKRCQEVGVFALRTLTTLKCPRRNSHEFYMPFPMRRCVVDWKAIIDDTSTGHRLMILTWRGSSCENCLLYMQ